MKTSKIKFYFGDYINGSFEFFDTFEPAQAHFEEYVEGNWSIAVDQGDGPYLDESQARKVTENFHYVAKITSFFDEDGDELPLEEDFELLVGCR